MTTDLGVLKVLSSDDRDGRTTIYGQPLLGVEWLKVVARILGMPGTQVAKIVVPDPETGRIGTMWKLIFPTPMLEGLVLPAKIPGVDPEQRPLAGTSPGAMPPGVKDWFRPLAVENRPTGVILVGHPRFAAKWAQKASELLSGGLARELAKVYVRRGTALYYVWRVLLGDPGDAQGEFDASDEPAPPPLPRNPRRANIARRVKVKTVPAESRIRDVDQFNQKLLAWQASQPTVVMAGSVSTEGTARALAEYRIGLSKLRLGKDGKLAGKREGENMVTTIPIYDPRPSALSRVITGVVTESGISGWRSPQGGEVVDIQPHALDRHQEE